MAHFRQHGRPAFQAPAPVAGGLPCRWRPPENIGEELSRLTQRIASEEVFHSLLDSLNAYIRIKDKEQANFDMSGLIAQVEATREELKQCEPANTALILTWLLGKAKDRKLLSKIRSQR